ncbi:MAG: hypothetical protein ACRC1K_03720, partial [Planctomycetia bacterium]
YLTPGNDRPPPPRAPKPTDGRIRVGLLSRFFCNHTIGNLNRGLAAKLNKKEFHLTILSAGEHHDDTNKAFRQAADQYVVIPQSPPLARPIVADQHLDVLFYLDLGMAPFTFSLAFSRLAPVQCVTWGHPLTTGIPTMDYFLSGQVYEGPESDGHYTEQLVRLAGLQTHYHRPVLRPRPRSYFGLPDGVTLYGCPQTLFKFHPDFDAVLSGIFDRDPNGRLVMIDGKFSEWNQLLVNRWRRTAPAVVDRVIFLRSTPRDDFIALQAVCDVLLDPMHFGGGNTTLEALAAGTPVVTLPPAHLRGRLASGMYKHMGMTDLIVDSTDGYVDLAARLGLDRDFRQATREKILASCGALFEDQSTITSFEEFFRSAVGKKK